MKVLTISDVSKSFYTKIGELEVIKDLNLEVDEGEIVAIVGPSGSGKSTILNLISGLLKPNSGKIKVNGNLGYMFQHDLLFEWRTVWKNILLGLEIRHKITDDAKEEIIKMLKKYDLYDFINNYPHELSGGMRQRIALIRTLALKPNILLLDEPFSALDYQTRIKVSDDVYNVIRNEKLSAILVTHDISEAIALADRVIVLSKRPAILKGNHKIVMQNKDSVTPLLKRKDPNFRMYFDEIWSELNEED